MLFTQIVRRATRKCQLNSDWSEITRYKNLLRIFVRAESDSTGMFLDKGFYVLDSRANEDGRCDYTSQGDFVTFNDQCTLHILKMCNGLMHCDDCADEVYEDCMEKQCSYRKYTVSTC